MNEYFHFIFSWPNVIPTFILCFCFAYWLVVIIGMIDMDMIDVDVDIDADADVSSGGATSVVWLNKILHFFNLGRIPFMVWLTIVGFIAWFGTTAVNFLLGTESFLIGSGIFVVAFIAAMIVAKPLTFPLVKIFDALEKSDGLKTVVGQVGQILYPNKGNTPGEAEIVHEGSHVKIFIVPSSKEIILKRDQKVLVISPTDEDPKIYLVEPYN